MRHGAEDQRGDQDPEGIAAAGAGQRIAAQRADGQRDDVTTDGDDQVLITGRQNSLLHPGAFIALPAVKAAGLA
jgi:hypothetical protein